MVVSFKNRLWSLLRLTNSQLVALDNGNRSISRDGWYEMGLGVRLPDGSTVEFLHVESTESIEKERSWSERANSKDPEVDEYTLDEYLSNDNYYCSFYWTVYSMVYREGGYKFKSNLDLLRHVSEYYMNWGINVTLYKGEDGITYYDLNTQMKSEALLYDNNGVLTLKGRYNERRLPSNLSYLIDEVDFFVADVYRSCRFGNACWIGYLKYKDN